MKNNFINRIISETLNQYLKNIINEAGGTLTSKVVNRAPAHAFNRDEVLKKALSYNTPSEIYSDKSLSQMLRRYHVIDGDKSSPTLMDYVRDEFAKAGKYKKNWRGKNNSRANNWTPESALEYASNFINGYELRENPNDPRMGRSCFHYLKTRDKNGNMIVNNEQIPLMKFAFGKARKEDAEKASMLLANKEEKLQNERKRKEQMAQERAVQITKNKTKRKVDKEAEKNQIKIDKELKRDNYTQEILNFIKQNNIRYPEDLKKQNLNYYSYLFRNGMIDSVFGNKENRRNSRDMQRLQMSLSKSDSPSHFKRYYPFSYQRMMQNGTLNQHYPGWEQINGVWKKVK